MNPFFEYNPRHFLPILLLAIWTFIWKGYALWLAPKRNQKGWFVALLVLNTFGILEIVYIFWVAKKKWAEVKNSFLRVFKPRNKAK